MCIGFHYSSIKMKIYLKNAITPNMRWVLLHAVCRLNFGILHIRGFVSSDFQYLRDRIQIRGYHHRVEREKIL